MAWCLVKHRNGFNFILFPLLTVFSFHISINISLYNAQAHIDMADSGGSMQHAMTFTVNCHCSSGARSSDTAITNSAIGYDPELVPSTSNHTLRLKLVGSCIIK